MVKPVEHLAVSQTLLLLQILKPPVFRPLNRGCMVVFQQWLGSGAITGIGADKNRIDFLRRRMNSPVLNGECLIVHCIVEK